MANTQISGWFVINISQKSWVIDWLWKLNHAIIHIHLNFTLITFEYLLLHLFMVYIKWSITISNNIWTLHLLLSSSATQSLILGSNTPLPQLPMFTVRFRKHSINHGVQSRPGNSCSPFGRPTQLGSLDRHGKQVPSLSVHWFCLYSPAKFIKRIFLYSSNIKIL